MNRRNGNNESCQSNAVGGTCNNVEDEIAVNESNVKVELSESARDGVKSSSDCLTGSGRQKRKQCNRGGPRKKAESKSMSSTGSRLQCAEHWRCTFCVRLVSAREFYPSISSNSSLVVMGIFDFTKVLSAQIPFTSYGFNAPTNNKMLYTRWMNDVASGNVTSLGVSSQSNAAAGEDSNEVEDVGLL
ncbi:hypothetical protein LWI29_006113 [Acer saccharum]|uniref:Uncharacterized protein n=1 Tax=Acer saccharum TaxID=4024 RepID=A0AA39SR42_ACESA|nr:hypothetical protein LWI29_006113 [Acer saccharum]